LQAYYANGSGLPSCGILGIVNSTVATLTVGAPITLATAGADQPAVVGTSTILAGVLGSGTSGTWSVVPANPSITFSASTSPTSTVSGLPLVGSTTLRWTVSNTGGCTISDDVLITRASVKVDIKAALEGPLNAATGEMYALIKAVIPQVGGYPNATVIAQTGTSAIVDWITVELRTTGNVAATGNFIRQGLIRADGRIVEASDGNSPLAFDVPDGSYFIAVKHRNHIGFRSDAESLTVAASPIIIDFASGIIEAHGTNALKQISGVYCAFSGNVDGNNQVNSLDYNIWRPLRFQNGYLAPDINLDGTVNSLDYNQWFANRFRSTQY
jgi:hypothetical protein